MSKSAVKILDTAEKLFNQNSFNAVGVDLIRDESGCSKTTMYSYFKNKNQLIQSVLLARDEKFKQSLFEYLGPAEGISAINRIFDWHMQWFQQDNFKGCLFVRAVAESKQHEQEINLIAKQHKNWIKILILKHCVLAERTESSELIYTLIEGLISRFLLDGFDRRIAANLKEQVNFLLSLKTSGVF